MIENKILSNGNYPLSQEQREYRINLASKYYGEFLSAMGFDWENDPNMKDTPLRVSKAFINELFEGCFTEPPKITAFDNTNEYDGIVLQSNIPVKSICSHHHQVISGIAHVAYIPNKDGKIIGLSKLNRIVEFFSRRPQVQENLTNQIYDFLDEIFEKKYSIAILIKAKHFCCGHRGVNHDSDMQTVKLGGSFKEVDRVRNEFYQLIEYANKK